MEHDMEYAPFAVDVVALECQHFTGSQSTTVLCAPKDFSQGTWTVVYLNISPTSHNMHKHIHNK